MTTFGTGSIRKGYSVSAYRASHLHNLPQVNMHPRNICRAALVATLSACATAPAAHPPPLPANDPAAMAIAAATPARWTGNLQPTQARTGNVRMTDRQKAYGTVEMTVPRDSPNRTRVRLTVSAPATSGVTSLRWGIYPGNCGSGAPPVVPAEVFPLIELSSNGQGSIDQEIAFEMPNQRALHVNVLQGSGTQLSNVLTCANLRRAN